jgi:SAM-dependent methyltransferase
MATCTKCDLCSRPGSLSDSVDVGKVPCNVRKYKDHVFTLWRCSGCGSIHCLEDADLTVYYKDYPLQRQRITFTERIGYRNRLRLMKRQGFRKSHRILDYGGGAGLFVGFLGELGYEHVFGYDPFVPAYADPGTLDQSYDVVVSYDVIEHYEDPREFLRCVSPLVRSGGLLVIGTPNADHVSISRIGDPNLHPPYHRHILSERILLALGQEQGMKPVHIYRRSFYDSLIPGANAQFLWRYLLKSGGFMDTVVEPPNIGLVLRSPEMVLLAFFGYFLPAGHSILVSFRKTDARLS